MIAGLGLAFGVSFASTLEPPIRGELLRRAPLGYFGCFFSITPSTYSCVAARQASAGVKIVFYQGVDFDNDPTGLPTVEHAWLPSGSLYSVERLSGEGPMVILDADLPAAGHIHLQSAASLYVRSTGNEGCPAYSVHYELLGSGPESIGVVTHDTGTINGIQVQDLGCNAYFTEPTSGLWWMNSI